MKWLEAESSWCEKWQELITWYLDHQGRMVLRIELLWYTACHDRVGELRELGRHLPEMCPENVRLAKSFLSVPRLLWRRGLLSWVVVVVESSDSVHVVSLSTGVASCSICRSSVWRQVASDVELTVSLLEVMVMARHEGACQSRNGRQSNMTLVGSLLRLEQWWDENLEYFRV